MPGGRRPPVMLYRKWFCDNCEVSMEGKWQEDERPPCWLCGGEQVVYYSSRKWVDWHNAWQVTFEDMPSNWREYYA